MITFREAGKQAKLVTDQQIVRSIRYFCEESKIYKAEVKMSLLPDYELEYSFDDIPAIRKIRKERTKTDENQNELKSIESAFTKIC